jgi:hypothetical protein
MTTSRNIPPPGNHELPEEGSDLESEHLERSDALWGITSGLGLDVKERRLVWSDDRRLTLEESVGRILVQLPDLGAEDVEDFLISFIENYAPEEYSEEQLDELDRLAEEWLDEIEDAREED